MLECPNVLNTYKLKNTLHCKFSDCNNWVAKSRSSRLITPCVEVNLKWREFMRNRNCNIYFHILILEYKVVFCLILLLSSNCLFDLSIKRVNFNLISLTFSEWKSIFSRSFSFWTTSRSYNSISRRFLSTVGPNVCAWNP